MDFAVIPPYYAADLERQNESDAMSRGVSKLSAALFGLAVLVAAPAAQAFTFENGNPGGADGAPSPFNNPQSPFNTPQTKPETLPNGSTRYQFGNSTITIGNQYSVDRDFQSGVDRIFSPLGRPAN